MAKPFTKKGWRNLTIIAGGIDAVQLIIDPTGIGAGINEIADPVIGLIFAFIYWRKGAMNAKSFMALVISFFGEEGTVSAAPLWVIDVWYTSRTAPISEDDTAVVAATTYSNEQIVASGPLNQGNVRQSNNSRQRPLNIKVGKVNVRPPNA